jgi:hypothetical protein
MRKDMEGRKKGREGGKTGGKKECNFSPLL